MRVEDTPQELQSAHLCRRYSAVTGCTDSREYLTSAMSAVRRRRRAPLDDGGVGLAIIIQTSFTLPRPQAAALMAP
jgi:hypothetical protein